MRRTIMGAGSLLVVLLTVWAPSWAGDLEAKLEERISSELSRTTGSQSSELLAVQQFYADRGFVPVWVGPTEAGPRARAAFDAIAGVGSDGLDPTEYGLIAITAELGAKTPAELANLEFLISSAFVNLGGDIGTGRVQPGVVDPELHISPKRLEPLLILSNAAAATDLNDYLRSLAPATPEYERLKATLAKYREIAEHGGWPTVPTGAKLEPGARGERVARLTARLRATDDLPEPVTDPLLFDPAVSAAVKRFQARHGITEDGIVAGSTLIALNVPVQRRIEQILLNLERRRWMPADLGERYVFVNLADFTLKVVDGTRTIHDTRVVVGKPFTRTPVFSGMMTYIVLNPYWFVPPSIAAGEILPKLRSNPGYLKSQNMRLFASGGTVEVDPGKIDWGSVGSRSFPYRVRQDAGEKNALGRIKFMFPNQFDIYLHDTPSRDLFQKTVRSFSHGCVRVHDPLALAQILLQDDPSWTRVRMDAVLATGDQFIVNLKRPIPVHLTYLTAWVNKDGTVNFRDDVYGRDKRLEQALKSDREKAAGTRT